MTSDDSTLNWQMKNNGRPKKCIQECALPQLDTTITESLLVNVCVGEIVWRRNEFAHQDNINNLFPKWEDPYKVITIAYPHAYVVEDMQRKRLKTKNTFDAEHLTKFYD